MRRLATIALSLSLLLGLTGTYRVLAQGEDKKETPKPAEAAKPDASKTEAAKTDASKTEAAKTEPSKAEAAKTEPAPPTIPPEVQAKLEAARRAVAEAIVAAEDAGLVKTSIDPPPIIDILVNGYANDESAISALKAADAKPAAVSPEVFGAWFSGYGKDSTINPVKQIRIMRPKLGLEDLYSKRANILKTHIEAVRKAKGDVKPKEEPKKEEVKKEEPKKEEVKKEEPKKDDAKKEEPKKDDAKKEEPKKDESKDDAKKEEPKKDDDTKKEEPK